MGKKHRMNQWDGDDEQIRSQERGQDELNEYIRVISPGTFVVILAMLILVAAVITWGLIGTLPVTETVTGLVIDTTQYGQINPEGRSGLPSGLTEGMLILSFVDASRYNGQAIESFGNQVRLKMPDQEICTGTIEAMAAAPVSMEKAKKILFDNDWILGQCVSQNYNWMLVIRPDQDLSQYVFTLAEVTFVTEEVAPIRFLMRQAGG